MGHRVDGRRPRSTPWCAMGMMVRLACKVTKRGENSDGVFSPFYRLCFGLRFLLSLLNDGLESLRVVHSEVSEHLTVDLDASLVKVAHELRVGEAFEASGSVDTLNPESAEVALLVATVTEGVGQTLLPSVLGNGPNVLAGTIVTASEFEDSLALCS